MPTFQGQVSEEQLLELIEYIKSLQGAAAGAAKVATSKAVMPSPTVLMPAAALSERRLRHQVVAADARPQAHRLLYLAAITFFFFVGGAFAVLIRLELVTPAGDLVTDETYNKLFTMHGVMMVFFFLIPSIPAVLGNFLVPLMIGAKDLAFPKLNLRAGTSTSSAALFTLCALVAGGVDTGWTFYTPFSTVSSTTNVIPAALGVFIPGFSSILTGLNFIVTIHKMRAPGMTWFRLPLFIWAHVRDQPDHGARHAGPRDHAPARRRRAALPRRHLRPARSAATRCCSSTCSGSTRTRPSTS